MWKFYEKFIAVLFVLLLDFCLTTVLFVRGHQWNIFFHSILNYSFPQSFIELWVLACLRCGIIVGALIGVLRNQADGIDRCKKSHWIIVSFACFNGYYASAKLLSFSDTKEFVSGPKVYWFWGLFAWTLAASFLLTVSWHLLSLPYSSRRLVTAVSSDDVFENQPLLKEDHLAGTFSTQNQTAANNGCINDGSFATDSYDDKKSHSNSYQNHSNISYLKKSRTDSEESDKKGYSELLNQATVRAMLSYSIPDWPWMVFGSIFLICASVAQVFLPLYIGKVISGIVVTKDASAFLRNILIMAIISLAASISSGLRGGCFMIVIQKLNIRVRNALFASITHQEIGFFDNVKTGDITSRLTSDTTTMSDTIGLNCNIFLRNVVKGIGVCVFMFALSWRMSILTFMGLPLVFAVSEVYGNYYKKLQKQVQDRFAIANEVAEEVCSSMQTVRSFANEDGERKRYSDKLNDVYAVQFKQAVSYSGYLWSTQSIELLLTVATLWFGGHLLMENNLSAENFISFILYQETLGECFSEIGEVYTGLMQALGAAEKVFELIRRKPVISTEDGDEKPDDIKGRISFKNVSFSYPMRPDQPILKDVSFDVNPGEVVALVGPSGGGKSSCVKLLQRFYDPTSGSVLLDGIPVRAYKHEYLHTKISMVGQEPVLYARSIRDNIVYGLDSRQYNDAAILEASEKANCHDFIMELPDGYDTETGEKGTQLSGGQKQRVAIARAMVRSPCVLLLDEATSALDTESEYLVQDALERSKSDRTVLLIAHRLSTVERADRIVVIVKGQVREIGSHRQLMEKQGVYYNLVRRQLHLTDKLEESGAGGDEMRSNSKHSSIDIASRKDNLQFFSPHNEGSCKLSSSLTSESSVASANMRI